MKKALFLFVVLAVFFVLPANSQAKTSMIELTQNATAQFTLTTGEVIKYADLLKGQYFVATKVENKWQLCIGNATVTIPEHKATVITKDIKQHKPVHKNELITTSPATVYVAPNNKAKTFAIIGKNMRISSNGRNGNYYEVIIGARKGYIRFNTVALDNGVPILIYHHFVSDISNSVFKDNSSVLDIGLFSEQMDYLQQEKYTTISLKDFDLWTQKKQALPGKVVALTFDDANLSIPYMVYPILQDKNMYATTFVITDRVKEETPTFDMEKTQFSGLEELRQIQDRIALEYHTFGLHTFNSLTGRSTLQNTSNLDVNEDFIHANDVFNTIDPTLTPSYFAYPYGKTNAQQESSYTENGVSLAFINKGGKAKITSPRLYVTRIPFQNGMTLEQFKVLVNN